MTHQKSRIAKPERIRAGAAPGGIEPKKIFSAVRQIEAAGAS
jgi:hypothetical protein